MILRIPLSDVLYISAKLNGGYDSFRHCTYIQPSFISPAVKDYLSSTEWKDSIESDLLLYKAVNQSLDMTIDRLGRTTFDAKLAKYRRALKLSEELCGPTAVFPCDKNVKTPRNITSCLWKDSGCGAACLDQVAADLGIDRFS